ncbi:MAG TPA: S9 family peptidase [Thermoanaerobaculia bacterium]|nr:S9 family peptidase [Thermoanaerobaculia bacterium]
MPSRKGKLMLKMLMASVLFVGSINSAEVDEIVNTRPPMPPAAKKIERKITIHDRTITDPYAWLREKGSPDVIAHLEAENAYTEAVMRPTAALQETLYQEILGRIRQTDLSVPYRKGAHYYYARTEEGKQYPIHCRKKGSLEAEEDVALDLNELATGETFLGLGSYEVSDDGHLLAYSTDVTGFRQYTLQFKDLRTGELLAERIERVNVVKWAADNKTVFYVIEDEQTKRSYRLYRHTLGSPQHELLYEETDELYSLWLDRTNSSRYLLAMSESATTSEVRAISADAPGEAPRLLLPRREGHEYSVDHRGDRFYIRTNDGARNFRLVSAPVDAPEKANWKEIVPHRSNVMLAGVRLFAGFAALREREDGLPTLSVLDLEKKTLHRVRFPESIYSASLETNKEFDTTILRYRYQSMVTPPSVFDYDMATRDATLLKQTEVLGGYERSRYTTERSWATAGDGAKIPISLVYRKDLKKDGRNPLLLYGYGAYGLSQSPTFSSNRFSLVDRGVIYAIAHVRGGGEMGKAWHDEGKMAKKMNTFTDFIAAAEHLIAAKYTAKEHLAIEGGSAGGLLVGAVVNMRPDLFRVALSHVPFVDVLNSMLDDSLPLTVGEYLEWGNPNLQDEYENIAAWCPYTNIAKRAYPAMLVKTSINDSQVMYWEPAKYVARLRAHKTDDNVLLFKCNMAAGHGGSSGRYDKLREIAFDYAFLLTRLGVEKGPLERQVKPASVAGAETP